ncbi:MAG: nuclear transport factor 2 family protein [Gemmatimonadaceae bacterium]
MRHIFVTGLSSLLASGAFCTALAQNPTPAATPAIDAVPPSVVLPPEVDRVLRDYERAWRSGDPSAVAALFAKDGFVLQSGRAPLRGRAAIATAYTGQAGGPLRLRAIGYATADTIGFIIGTYGYGEGNTDMGKFTVTLRRDRNGSWQIFSDMDNGSQSRRPSTSAPAAP